MKACMHVAGEIAVGRVALDSQQSGTVQPDAYGFLGVAYADEGRLVLGIQRRERFAAARRVVWPSARLLAASRRRGVRPSAQVFLHQLREALTDLLAVLFGVVR